MNSKELGPGQEYSELLRDYASRVEKLYHDIYVVQNTKDRTYTIMLASGMLSLLLLITIASAFVWAGQELYLGLLQRLIYHPSFVPAMLGLFCSGFLYQRWSRLSIERDALTLELWIAFKNLETVTKRISETEDRMNMSPFVGIDLRLKLSEAEKLLGVIRRSRFRNRLERFEADHRLHQTHPDYSM